MIIYRHNSSDITSKEEITIMQHNSGDICAKAVTIKKHNSGDISSDGTVIVDGHNSGDINAHIASVRKHNSGQIVATDADVGGHNTGDIESSNMTMLNGNNAGTVISPWIYYQGFELSQDVLVGMSQNANITYNTLVLTRKSENKWEIEDKANGSVNELKIKNNKLEMIYVRGGKNAITTNGVNISMSGSGTITINNGSITITN